MHVQVLRIVSILNLLFSRRLLLCARLNAGIQPYTILEKLYNKAIGIGVISAANMCKGMSKPLFGVTSTHSEKYKNTEKSRTYA
jgi:hypothetical protein